MAVLRWVIRLALTVAAFFVGNFVMFLFLGYAVFGFFEPIVPGKPDRPTTQDWFDILTTLSGLALAALMWFKTKWLTTQEPTSEL